MDTPRFIVDSNILIDTLNHRLDLLAFLDTLGECEAYINLIIEVEVLSKPDMTAAEEAEARALLDCFRWADFDPAVRQEAVRIRRSKDLLLPDALIAASAIVLGATVISNDPHLRDYTRPGYAAITPHR
jgi:predicted nucleic acid-binding protein